MLPALTNTTGGPTDGALAIPSLDDLVEAFLDALSSQTRRAYDGDLRDFARHVFPDAKAPSARDAVGVLLAHGPAHANLLALGYRTAMEGRRLAPATVARRLSALRSVVELANTLGRVSWSLRVKRPTVESYRDVRGPGRDGWRRMVGRVVDESRAVAGETPAQRRRQRQAIRDLALVRLLHDLMLRRSEAAGLDLEHVEFEGGRPVSIWILGKGRRQRERLELAPATTAALADWLHERGLEAGPLFFALDRERGEGRPSVGDGGTAPAPRRPSVGESAGSGDPRTAPVGDGAGSGDPRTAHTAPASVRPRLSDRSIARAVTELGERAGLTRHVAPHGLRHEAITRAVEMGQPLRDVQLTARHRDPRTTQKYIDRANNPQPKISRMISED